MIMTQPMRTKSHFDHDPQKQTIEVALPPVAINRTKEAAS
jgi:hypothetical protein